MASEM